MLEVQTSDLSAWGIATYHRPAQSHISSEKCGHLFMCIEGWRHRTADFESLLKGGDYGCMLDSECMGVMERQWLLHQLKLFVRVCMSAFTPTSHTLATCPMNAPLFIFGKDQVRSRGRRGPRRSGQPSDMWIWGEPPDAV